MNFRAALGLALLVAAPSTLSAQSAPRSAGALSLTAGVGAGSTSFSCDACASQRDNGIGAFVRVGIGLSSRLALALEASGWRADYEESRGEGEARVGLAQLVAQWYPSATAGAFLKLGGGIAAMKDELSVEGLGTSDVSTRNPAFVVGAGWEIPIARRLAITPFADVNYIAKGDQTINDVTHGGRLGATLLHAGVAIRVR